MHDLEFRGSSNAFLLRKHFASGQREMGHAMLINVLLCFETP